MLLVLGLRARDLRRLGHPRRARLGRGPPRRDASRSVQSNSLWIFTVIAAVGTTLTPWGQFFIQAAVVDKKVPCRQYVYTKYEIYAGSVFMTTIDFFIVVACAATLYKEGIVVAVGAGGGDGAGAVPRARPRSTSSASAC